MNNHFTDKPDPHLKNALDWASAKLANLPNPDLESELLLEFATGEDKSFIIANPDYLLTKTQADSYIKLVNERLSGKPLAYITGVKEFYGREFITSPQALIPRPESEVLINQVKTIVSRLEQPKILDIGTGSGCLAVTLAAEISNAHIKATDISKDALEIAKANAKKHDVINRIVFAEQNLLLDENGHYDAIVANLPYVEDHWLAASAHAKELSFEPRVALSGGEGGLDLIKELLRQYAQKKCGQVLLIEHGDHQEEVLLPFIKKLLPEAHIRLVPDQFGLNRIISISL